MHKRTRKTFRKNIYLRLRKKRVRTTARKGGYTDPGTFVPNSEQSEINYTNHFLRVMERSRSHKERINVASIFFKQIMHFRYLLEDRLFVRAVMAKLQELANETDVPPDFHADRMQVILFLEQ